MQPPDKIVLEHAGALGDFILAWPFFLSLSRHFPGVPAFRAAPPSHGRWLAPLAAPCPPELRRALDARFAGDAWPRELEGALVFRPGLAARPALPSWEGFRFVSGVVPGRDVSPLALYREALDGWGIPFAHDYREAFQGYFGGHGPTDDTALLFPGAGHMDKAWPLALWQHLARRLREYGVRPVFVIGPVERDRGIVPQEGEILEPEDLEALSQALRGCRFAIGPDCGPMHLAGLHGVPGVALFGPTSPRQWGPAGLEIMSAGLPCAPCTAVTSGEFAPGCARPLPCMACIAPGDVLDRLRRAGLVSGRP